MGQDSRGDPQLPRQIYRTNLRRRTLAGRLTTWTLPHNALAARLPNDLLRTGQRVTGLLDARRRPVLRFADSHTESADLVVFADGRCSTSHRLLDPGRRLRSAGYVAHRDAAASPAAAPADVLRRQPCPWVRFNLGPVPAGCDWTFYLNAITADDTTWFGTPPVARARVDVAAEQYLPEAQTALAAPPASGWPCR
jgi:2-polyprenyl-6-methoxyphenol hydroxylase-like FAD-dependent oxidoreductase